MDLGLLGRAALVTGARSGIGAAVAEALAREGCDVAVADRVVDAATEAVVRRIEAAGPRAMALECDIRTFAAADDAVRRTVKAFGRLDIVVASAGVTADAVSWKMTEEQWDAVLDVNLKGSFAIARAAAPVLRQRAWGRIVLVGSINGRRGKFGQANYAASKAGVVGLGKTLARELGRFGVAVNVVAPGMVATPMTAVLPAEAVQRAKEESVLGRIAEPADIADTVVFLCSDRARHVTGTVVTVDGGQDI
jgi:3-oxoacyl-[acyl-carrier protein] reductase